MENFEKISAAVRAYREKMLADPYRPTWHFCVPDDNGMPGDPNGAFYADGRYHLMYLYRNTSGKAYHWGHISSCDLLHWRHHPDALTSDAGDEGCYSGGAFLDDDGCCYLTFWKFGAVGENPKDAGGIALAKSYPPYDVWERMEPIAVEQTEYGIYEVSEKGETQYLGCADPSNIWKSGEHYYMQAGNLMVLNKCGRGENSDPKYQGDWVELLRSDDLQHWEYVHRLYTNTLTAPGLPDASEDGMCPQFLPLPDAASGGNITDKYCQLFISHNHGAQYYIGRWDADSERFYPEIHGRFSHADRACFAPEALIDEKNRQLVWYWLLDNPENDFAKYGWSGVYTFPRALWFDGNTLCMAPAEELSLLQSHTETSEHICLSDGNNPSIPAKNGASFRLRAEIDTGNAEQVGFYIRSDKAERTEIYYDTKKCELVADTTNSGCDGWKIKEYAPFELKAGEKLSLDILVDRSVVEVYANERQAIARRVYPTNPENAVGIFAFARGGEAVIERLTVSEIEPANPY